MPSHATDDPIVILGAGLSGLSLACALRDRGVRRPLVLLDRRREWSRDRTWCTWLTGPLRFSGCITHRWPEWETRTATQRVRASAPEHPYVHLDAELVYEAALDRLSRAGDVEIRTGATVQRVDAGARTQIVTSDGTLEATTVFDAMGANGPLQRRLAADAAGGFRQRFTGWEVQIDRPVFDPGVATLMDFRGRRGPGVTFMYELPFSPTRALLEHTSIEPPDAPRIDREAVLADELDRRFGPSRWTCLRRERGSIPMVSGHFGVRSEQGVWRVGAGAGAIRPSSGYAFSRIQSHVDRIARALAAGRPLPGRVSSTRLELLDRIFLQALSVARRPERIFMAAATVPGPAFARFMTDVSSPADDARLIRALPRLEMARAAIAVGARGISPGARP